MFKTLHNTVKNHYSLGLMAFGSLSVFMANIFFKDMMAEETYYKYSILVIFISLMNSFGLLGLEQVFVRLTKIKQNKLFISIKNIKMIGVFTLLNAVLCSFVLKDRYQIVENLLLLIVLSILVLALMFFYNLLRLHSKFVLAQLATNAWKLALGLILGLQLLFSIEFTFNQLLLFLVFILVIVFILCIKYIRKIQFVVEELYDLKEILKLSFQFFISLLSLSFIAQSDKLIVDEFFSQEDFVNYFYLANLFLFPFSFIQAYIGFKEIVVMKKDGQYDLLRASLKIGLIAILFASALFFIIQAIDSMGLLSVEIANYKTVILLFLITGVLRMIYAIYSTYFSCYATTTIVKKANVLSIVSLVVLFMVIVNSSMSLDLLASYLFLLWLLRLLIWGGYSFTLKKMVCATN